MLIFITAISVALVVSFLCSIFESVLLSIGHARVESLASGGRSAGVLLRRFKRNIDVPIAAILIANTVAHTVGASVAGATYEDVFERETLWVFTIVFTTAVLMLTEIIPKTLGVTHASTLAVPVAYGIQTFVVLLRPLVALSGGFSRLLRLGKDPPLTSLEEIRFLAALGRSEGVVGVRTAHMIEGAARLRELKARDVMVPRKLVTFLSGTKDRHEILDIVRRTRHSRFPFTPTEELDHATGFVLAKDLLLTLIPREQRSIPWDELVREPLIVPFTMPLNVLLRTFKETRSHLAIVVDEHGGVDGIVTLEDVLEEIVGEIVDESDLPSESLERREDGSYLAPATLELRKVCDHLGVPWDASSGVLSLGGLVAKELGRLPVQGDAISWQGFRIVVLRASPRRAEHLSLMREPEGESEP